MSRFAIAFVTLAGVAFISASAADAKSYRALDCTGDTLWSVCQGTPVGAKGYHAVTPPHPSHSPSHVSSTSMLNPEGPGSISGGGGGGGGAGGGK